MELIVSFGYWDLSEVAVGLLKIADWVATIRKQINVRMVEGYAHFTYTLAYFTALCTPVFCCKKNGSTCPTSILLSLRRSGYFFFNDSNSYLELSQNT